MVEVLINVPFNDKYTGKLYAANSKVVITKERAIEIQNFNKGFITVLKEVEEKKPATKKKAE
jgi:hypothetical protein